MWRRGLRQRRTGHQPAAQCLRSGGETHEADACSALLLVQVQVEDADIGEVRKEAGNTLLLGIDVRVDVLG